MFIASCLFAGSCLIGQEFAPPGDYYSPAENLLGDGLRTQLHDIIDNHMNLGYDAMRIAPRVLDADPEVADNIILIYSGASVAGYLFNSAWNREHTWPQSYGADSSLKPGADFHHLFPANGAVNSTRSNLPFDWSDGTAKPVANAPGSTYDGNSFEPRDEDKGRIARAMLYMDLRYEASDGFGDFNLGEAANQAAKRMAKLSTLLQWNRMFPPDEREQRRNHLIHTGFTFGGFTYTQGNRNPFVDFPDLGDALFTSSERIAWGTWRWSHFSISQYLSGNAVGELDDPDEDYLVNLLEYSANLDPTTPDEVSLLTRFNFPGFGVQLRFTRQKGFALDGLAYELQTSSTPLREETWTTLEENDFTSFTISATGDTELVTATIPDPGEPTWFRLQVSRTLGENEVSAVFDPVRTANPSDSIFVYDSTVGDTPWKQSDWMGYVIDDDYPWVYHFEHTWLYLSADRDDLVWYLDPVLGWMYTSSELYPFLYHLDSGEWLLYQVHSARPNRWFFSPTAGWVTETQLTSQITAN